MTEPTRITYLFDPLCGWCYGAARMLEDLAGRPEFAIDLRPTGLFAGDGARPMDDRLAAYATANDQRIARLSGAVFSDAYRRIVLADRGSLLDSGPATLALTAAALAEPTRELEVLKAIQCARYVDGRDITSPQVLAAILVARGVPVAAERVLAPDADLLATTRQRLAAARTLMRRFDVSGVPTLIVGDGDTCRRVGANTLFTSFDLLVASLKAA